MCWYGQRFARLRTLKRHQESCCPITLRRSLVQSHESKKEDEAEPLAQHKVDQELWKAEKRRAHCNFMGACLGTV